MDLPWYPGSACDRILAISGSNPMSSMRSAWPVELRIWAAKWRANKGKFSGKKHRFMEGRVTNTT